ncbi:hypothetical protein GGR21_002640 [Dysgonomonas hofstadii]|uniref:Uncharacterized protein n=1 Tax=Dysgonomonas hofstadii TaxID=637886 RepID=A0A840CSU3_9BACT|nr:hypothetical protein [Dysgonomonas hofstadii]
MKLMCRYANVPMKNKKSKICKKQRSAERRVANCQVLHLTPALSLWRGGCKATKRKLSSVLLPFGGGREGWKN